MSGYKKHVFILFAFLIVITGIRLPWIYFLTNEPEHPIAENGILDLRSWKMPADRTIPLDGQWAFYPSRLLESAADPDAAEGERTYLQVPGPWDSAFADRPKDDFRYGTYRLRILIGDTDRQYQIRIREVKTASAVYINGKFAGGSGHPSDSAQSSQARNIPYTVELPTHLSSIDVFLQVSDHTGETAIAKSLRFGTEEEMDYRLVLSLGSQTLLGVVLLIHVIYGIILFLLGTKNRGLIYFALTFFCALISVLAVDERILFSLFVWPYNLAYRVSLLSYIGVAAFIPPMLQHIVPGSKTAGVSRWFAYYGLGYALFAVAAPMKLVSHSLFLLGISLIGTVLISGGILYQAARKNQDVIYLLMGCISLGANVFWTIYINKTQTDWLTYPFDLILAVFGFATYWFKQFFRSTQQTRQLAGQLQLANKKKDEFLVNTSHELRNPLNGMMNLTQIVLEDTVHPVHPAHKDRLQIQLDVARRMSLMLDDLLDVARLRENIVRLHLQDVRLPTITSGIVEMLRHSLIGKSVDLQVDIDDTFPAVRADENRLIQILFNLLHNAVKFTEQGTISLTADHADGVAFIRVRDTGIGMDGEMLERIFLPYEQGDPDAAHGGFGIGLSVCKQLVELHGGEIRVRSALGRGSEFTFTLSLSGNTAEVREPEPISPSLPAELSVTLETAATIESANDKESASDRPKPKLLIVDDDALNVQILADILGKEQYEIHTSTSPGEALQWLGTKRFDLVISDVMMPHISGYELTSRIRERFALFELPVLLLTARSRSDDILTGFRSGANDYVTKPVDAWELRSRVHALTGMKLSIEERLRVEAAWLQAQIQPHFLYNTINSIAALAAQDLDKMQDMLQQFSQYLRTSFDFHNSDRLVSIERELELVRSYLFIEKERYRDRLRVHYELEEGLRFQLPPLTIQPLVENAVNHGIMKRLRGGDITIRIASRTDEYEITVQDNGVGMKADSPAGNGVALRNIDKRLQQVYGKGLQIHSVPGHGTTVRFQIPMDKKE